MLDKMLFTFVSVAVLILVLTVSKFLRIMTFSRVIQFKKLDTEVVLHFTRLSISEDEMWATGSRDILRQRCRPAGRNHI